MAEGSVFSAIARASVQKRGMLAPVDGRGPRGGWWPIVREPYTGAWQNDDEWTSDTVLAHHAVYSCITLISNDIGKLRPMLVERDDKGIWIERQSAAFSPVLRRPNRYQNHIQFKQWWVTSKLIRGNAYGLKQRDARGVVVAIYVLDPSRVTVLVSESGDVFYQLNSDNLTGVKDEGLTVPASEIIHDRMNCLFHPLVGVSPLYAAGCVANLGLKIERNSSRFFGNASQPGGILTAPGAITDDTAKRLADYFNRNFTGANAGRIAAVGDNLKFEPLGINATDSQLIEQLKWTAEVICSTFHVPPYKIGVGQVPSYNNVEALQQDYYNTCLQSLIEEFEACMDHGLGLDGVKEGIELDLDGLLRMDSATQIKVLSDSVSGQLRTINECRRKLNLPDVEGGNSVWMQQQDTSLAALAERDRRSAAETAKPPPSAPSPGPDDDESQRQIGEWLMRALGCARQELEA